MVIRKICLSILCGVFVCLIGFKHTIGQETLIIDPQQETTPSSKLDPSSFATPDNLVTPGGLVTPSILLDTSPKVRTPKDKPELTGTIPTQKSRTLKTGVWKSDHFQHQKLIFDEPIVEQHGLTKGEKRQVFESGAKFFLRGILFPLQFATRKPHRCCDSNQGWESNEGYQFSKKCNCIDCRR